MCNKNLVLTRYLYSKTEVEQSLLLALLEHNMAESKFWAYELYFSGFKTDIFEYIMRTFDFFYKKENKSLENFIIKTTEEWQQDQTKDYLLGTIVGTLATRNYRIDDFISTFYGVKCFHIPKPPPKKKFIIKLKPEDIDAYRTVEMSRTKNWQLLSIACKYSIRNNVNELFDNESACDHDEHVEIYNSNRWLYYAVKSPIWKDRVAKFSGSIDDEMQHVSFPDDDAEDAFHDDWGYEPDEQTAETKQQIMGDIYKTEQLSLDDFCLAYGAKIEREHS